MKNNLLRVALYIRVSSEEQANSGDSIRDQKSDAKSILLTMRTWLCRIHILMMVYLVRS